MPQQLRHDTVKAIKDKKIEFIHLWFTDVLGFLKSFTIDVEELELAMTEGMGFDGSSIQGFARIQESDMIAMPDPSTLQILPWRQKGVLVATMFCDIVRPDGTPYDADPRRVLKRNLERAEALGFTMYVGPELEYYYLKSDREPEVLELGTYFDQTTRDLAIDLRM
ncbi:MAG: glutamine synthetase beta-grasp domain-containing protein, partial [Coriobacteriia bacterium]|nr:glutamine synthetase beta-grasp domain-containing protein [Coriobacteriia bacterium]